MGFFTGSSPCYCCGNKYWIRKYDPTSTLPVLAEADIQPVPDYAFDIYPWSLIARGSKVTSLWINGNDDRFSRYSSDLDHELNITVTHTTRPSGVKWWDTNGSSLVVIVNNTGRFYNSTGSLVFTLTPPGTEVMVNIAVDSAGNMYSTTVSQTTFPPVTNRFLYKHNSSGTLQWKNSTNSSADEFLAVASDDFVWIYRPNITLLERRSGTGAITSAAVDLGSPHPRQTQAAQMDGSTGLWVTDSDSETGAIRTKHVTSSLVVDRGWWGPGASGTLASPSAPNILAFDAMQAVYARVVDVYFGTGSVESMQKLDTYGTPQWRRNRTTAPSYWGYGTASFPLANDVKAIAFADGYLYAAGVRTS